MPQAFWQAMKAAVFAKALKPIVGAPISTVVTRVPGSPLAETRQPSVWATSCGTGGLMFGDWGFVVGRPAPGNLVECRSCG